jgi:hypothetical protein
MNFKILFTIIIIMFISVRWTLLHQSSHHWLSDWHVESQSHVKTDGLSASLSWCQAVSGAEDQIFVTVRQLRVCSCGAPSLTRGRVSRLRFLLALAIAVIFTAVKISRTCHPYDYLQFYMAALYAVSCQESGSFWTPNIYSFTCNSNICMFNIRIYNAWHCISCRKSCSSYYKVCLVTAHLN